MPTNSYDLIVVGDDFAGLVAGTLCSRRGMRVLILSHSGRPTSYQLGPHRLPVEPLCLAGLGSPAIQRVMDELHLTHAFRRKLHQRAMGFQFVAPDVRVDVAADDHVLLGELARELGDGEAAGRACTEAAAVAQHFDAVLGADAEFPPMGFWKRREVGRNAARVVEEADAWLASVADDPIVRALVTLPAHLGTRAGAETLSAAACARSFHLWRTGTPRLQGDWDALRELLLEQLGKSSGETRAGRVAELTFSWGRVNGVRLESGEELGAGHVIAALPVSQLMPLVERKMPKRLAQCAEAVSVAGYRYTLNLVVDESGVPEGMSSPVLLIGDPAAPPVGDNAVAIYVDAPDDEGRVTVTLSAVCPAPADDQPLEQAFAALRERLRERIETVMPFLDGHILVAHSPQEATPPEGIKASAGRGLPVEPAPVWASTIEAALGVSAVPYTVGVKHLTIASSQVLPQLGVEGQFAAGWSAARLACDASGKKRDYREVLATG